MLVEIIAQDGETVVAEQLLAKIDTEAKAEAGAAAPAEDNGSDEAAAEPQAAASSNAQAGVAMPQLPNWLPKKAWM